MITRDGEIPIYDSTKLRVPFLYELSELLQYRFLLWNLVMRDLRIRYKRSVLGVFWAMINPFLTMVVLTVVFSRIFRFEIPHYPIYVLSGLLLWNLFSRGTAAAMRSMMVNSQIQQKIHTPPSVFVAASIGGALIHLLFALVPLIILAFATGIKPGLAWLFLPVPILLTTLFAFGAGLIVAALAVFFADVMDIYEVLINAFFYATPIIYPLSILPEPLAQLQSANLFHQFVGAFRLALIENTFPQPGAIALAALATLTIVTVGWALFTRLSDQFAYLT